MTVPFQPPTRGPVMNFFGSTSARKQNRKKKKGKEKQNLGQPLPRVSLPRLTWTLQPSRASAAARLTGLDYATFYVTGPAPANGRRIPLTRALLRPRPSANQRGAEQARVHRGTWLCYSVHVSGLLC